MCVSLVKRLNSKHVFQTLILAVTLIGGIFASEVGHALSCGDTIVADTKLRQDLDCRDYQGGVALRVQGDGIKLDGRGYRILAPLASFGVYIKGHDVTVKNINVSGLENGRAIFAEDSPGLRVLDSELVGNMIGIHVYANRENVPRVVIRRNKITDSISSAVLINDEEGVEVGTPAIRENDFSRTKGYVIHANARRLALTDNRENVFDDSENGVYFTGGHLAVHDLDLSQSRIKGVYLAAVQADKVTVIRSNLSSNLPYSDENTRYGVHAYRVKHIVIHDSVINGQDVAVKVATDSGTATRVGIRRSEMQGTYVAAVQIQSYDQTELGRVRVRWNDFSFNSTYAVWVVPGTILGPKSRIFENEI